MNTIALFFTNQFLPHYLEVRPVLELRHRAVFVDVVGILVVIVALVNMASLAAFTAPASPPSLTRPGSL